MPKFSPVNAIVTSTEIGGGKAIVEMKAARSTLTLELAEDSGWLQSLTEGAVVAYTIDVTQLGAPAGDQITSTQSLESSAKQEPPVAAKPQRGFANKGIDDIKDLLGIAGGSSSGPAPTTGTISRTP